MAFPTTPILSTFTGTENPLSEGGLWVGDMQKAGGVAFGDNGSGVYRGARWVASFTGNVEMYVTMPTIGLSTHEFYMTLDAGGGGDAYEVSIIMTGGSAVAYDLYRKDDGSATSLDDTTGSLANDVSFGLERISGVINFYVKDSGGSWTLVLTASDATYTGAVQLVVTVESDTMTLDNFGGGTVVVGGSAVLMPQILV